MFGISNLNGLGLPPSILQGLQGLLQGGDNRAAFIAILTATAANASKKPNFNLELEINDLWVRLGNLRNTPSSPGVGRMLQGVLQGVGPQLNRVLQTLVETSRK